MKKLSKQDFYNLLLTQGNSAIIKKGKQLYANNYIKLVSDPKVSDVYKFSALDDAISKNRYQIILKPGKNGMINLCTCTYSKSGICQHIVSALFYMINYSSNRPITKEFPLEAQIYPYYNPTKGDFKFQIIDEEILAIFNQLYENPQQYIDEKLIKITQAEHKTCKADFIDKAVKHNLHFFLSQKNIAAACSCMASKKKPCLHKVVLLNLVHQKFGKQGLHAIIDKEKVYDRLLEPFGFDHTNYPEKVFKFKWKGSKIVLDYDKKSLISETFISKTAKNLNFVDKTNQLNAFTTKESLQPVPEKIKLGYWWRCRNDVALEIIPFLGKTTKNGEKFYSNFDEKENNIIPGIDNNETIAIQDSIAKLNYVNHEFGFDSYYYNQYYRDNEVADKLEHLNMCFPVIEDLFDILKDEMNGYFNEDYPKSFKNYVPIQLSSKRVDLKIEVTRKGELYEMYAKPILNDEFCEFDDLDTSISQFFVSKNDTFFLHKNSAAVSIFQMFNTRSKYHFFEKDFPKLYKEILLPASENFELDLDFDIKLNDIKTDLQAQIYLKEMSDFLLLRPFVQYGEHQVELFSEQDIITIDENENLIKTERDKLAELQLQNILTNLHPKFESQIDRGFFFLTVNELLKDGWFFDAFEKLKEQGFEIFGQKELQKIKYNPHKPSVSFGVSSGIDWFEVNMKVQFGDTTVKLSDIRKAFVNQQNYVKLSDGTLGILPETWIKKYEMMLKMGEVSKGNQLKLSKLHFSVLDQLFDDIDELEVQKEIHEKKKKLLSFTEIKDAKVPEKVKATLRPYQIKGYQWLNFVDEFNWGGILADDMGLGKTLQILTLLTAKQAKNKELKALAVLPTTLIFNWENEIKKFCPHLTYHIHRGSKRAYNKEDLPEANVYLTSYGLMVNDIEWLKEIKFDYAILDESQAIKNPTSKRYKAARLLNAKNRLAMTGTPIENNTVDLFSQFNFVNPGFLGSLNFFKKEFAMPIDRDSNPEKSEQLKKIIYPFLLRRTKEEVATDLPDKVEDIIYCEMEPAQRKVYDAFRNNFRQQILEKIDEDGIENSKIQVLAALTQLRLICNSPAILNTEESYGNASVKLDILMEHINEKTSNHKVLIFSQFVKMLSLIRGKLEQAGLPYEYLDGKTSVKNRKAAVDHFQKDEKCRVFLISLKAGGTGINLTAADYVYLVDPWWNPAVESQAIDRTHRIGQDKKVFAYRMICKNTIEEMIIDLQKRKKSVSQDIISSESGFMKKLTKADIEALFN